MLAALAGGVRNLAVLTGLLLAACGPTKIAGSEDQGSTSGVSITITPNLTGCDGVASSTIPADGTYVMTTFGGGADDQPMSCGGQANGVGWYAASRQRYGCGAHLQVEANGKCVVLEAMDYGPDVCVENAADSPVLDMSPAGAKILYDTSSAGWSDHLIVQVTEVSADTVLGPCEASSGGSDGGGSSAGSDTDTGGGATQAASCSSSTLDRDVSDGECVQSASDGNFYECDNGNWDAIADTSACSETYAFCESATLGYAVPPRTCVQSGTTGIWYQCNGESWVSPVDTDSEAGPVGDCSDWYPN